ncbi:MAG TPA: site-specific integrase, partial [Longimicrobiales bacterium]
AEWGSDAAVQRATAVGQLWDRGDWPVLRRWQAGEVHVTELLRAVRDGDYDRLRRVNTDGYLLERAVEEHLQRTEATRRPATLRNHRMVCQALLDCFGADRPMHTITTQEIEAFLHAPRETIRGDEGPAPWSPATQAHYRMVGGALWRYAIEREAEEAALRGAVPSLTRNPWRSARIRRDPRVRPSVLTPEEIRDLLAHPEVQGTPQAAFLACAAYAGLRQQEIAHLRTTEDVVIWPEARWTRTQAGVLRIQNRKGEDEWYAKTDHSERDVPITPALARMILDHIRRGYAGARYLFRAPGRDEPIHPSTAARWTERAFEAAGIRYGRTGADGLTLHHLRHSYATMLLSQGVSIAVVAELMGDTQEVVLQTYSHALPNDRERALAIVEAVATGKTMDISGAGD